jgi:resolvase-like protein
VLFLYDIETGRQDLAARGRGRAHEQFAIPVRRDGGIQDLQEEAARPDRRFDAVVCKSVDRIARRTYLGVVIEHALEGAGVQLLAADEPGGTTDPRATRAARVLTRWVKQGIAEWYVLNMLEKSRAGFEEHTRQGFNIGAAPYGYLAEPVPHPVAAKKAEGKAKTTSTSGSSTRLAAVFGRAAAAARVAAGDDMGLGVLDEMFNVRRGGLVEATLPPLVHDLVPVGAVHPAGPVGDPGGHHRHVLGERRHDRLLGGGVQEIVRGNAHPRQKQPGGIQVGSTRWGDGRGAHPTSPRRDPAWVSSSSSAAGGYTTSRPPSGSATSRTRSPICTHQCRTVAGSRT